MTVDIDVTLTVAELARQRLQGRIAVAIDVVRASTTIIQGLASGCAGFLPVASLTEARKTARALPAATTLLGGERLGLPVPGFHLSNSPREYTPDRVQGKTIVFTTSNGTAAIKAARAAEEVIIAAFMNLEAVARYLAGQRSPITIGAAGRYGRPGLDDTVCAGMLAQRVAELSGEPCTLADGGRIALEVCKVYQGRLPDLLAEAAAGRAVRSLGYGADLELCGSLNAVDVVPRVVDGRITR